MADQDPPADEGESDAVKAVAKATTAGMLLDIALREGTLLARRAVQRKLSHGSLAELAEGEIPPRQSLPRRIATAALARLAARSVPGTLVVAGGLAGKALLDRRKLRKMKDKDDAASGDEAPE